MKVALCQVNPVVGDVDGNAARIRVRIAEARAAGADLAVFPELAVGGYPPRDLVENPRFIEANSSALARIAADCRGIAAIVGFVERNPHPAGRPLRNAAALLADGRIAAVRAKTLLPTHDVFDEARHFEPARANAPVPFLDRRIGITICEDLWNPDGAPGRRRYLSDPVASLVAQGADFLVTLSASPFEVGKDALRRDLFARHVRRHAVPLVVVNQVGGNDELLFDGRSLAFNARGEVCARARAFAEDLVVADPNGLPAIEVPAEAATAELHDALVMGLADYARKCGFREAVLGLSGGIDSAVVAALAARALGPKHVRGVAMPSEFSSEGSLRDAEALARNLGIRFSVLPIRDIFGQYKKTLAGEFAGFGPDVTEENLQARARGTLLMALANKFGALPLATGNKSELAMGYCTLYGDMCGGLAVIGDVLKTGVYRLAAHINAAGETIPRASIEKPPSAELRPNQRDQDTLPPYETLDAILSAYLEEGRTEEEIAAKGFARDLVAEVLRTVERNEFKRRQAPPALKVSPKAFGTGRRMPIARGWPG